MTSAFVVSLALANAIFLLITLIVTLVSNDYFKYQPIQKAELCALGVSLSQYGIFTIISGLNIPDTYINIIIRVLFYFNWVVTSPLRLFTYWKLANLEGYNYDFGILIAVNLVMVLFAILGNVYYHNFKFRLICFFVVSLCYTFITYNVVKIQNFFKGKNKFRNADLGNFFIIGWLIFPLITLFQGEFLLMILIVFDFFNKVLYGIALNNVIKLDENK